MGAGQSLPPHFPSMTANLRSATPMGLCVATIAPAPPSTLWGGDVGLAALPLGGCWVSPFGAGVWAWPVLARWDGPMCPPSQGDQPDMHPLGCAASYSWLIPSVPMVDLNRSAMCVMIMVPT